MGGQTTTSQNSSQQSQTQPWAPAQPLLQGLIGNLGNINTGVSGAQSAAAGALNSATQNLPSFAPQISNTASTLFGGGQNFGGILGDAYRNLQGTLSPLTDPSRLNPFNTLGFSSALQTAGADITNRINDQFAAAGRDLSPDNSRAVARGLGDAYGQLIANQYNTNANNQLAAANALFGAGNTTASGLTGFAQTQLGNQLQGANLAGQIPNLLLGPAQAQLAAATAAQNLPLQNLAPFESLLTPLAALGSQTSGTGQSTTTQSVPLGQQILGGAIGGLGLWSGLGVPFPKLFGGGGGSGQGR